MTLTKTSVATCCSICGGTLGSSLVEISEPDRFERHAGITEVGYVRRWLECSKCGAAINVHPDGVVEKLAAIASGYYEIDLQGSSVSQKYQQVMDLPASGSDNAMRVARIGSFIAEWHRLACLNRPTLRVLDIGAGTGVFLSKFISEEGKLDRTWGGLACEPDELAAAHLRALKMFDVRQGLFAPSSDMQNFDLCTLNKVVEHLLDPVDLIRQAGTALTPTTGVLYVEVPAKETIFCRPSNDNILGALHHHLYDLSSLDAALRAAGMVPMRLERIYEPSGKISIVGFAVKPEAVTILQARGKK